MIKSHVATVVTSMKSLTEKIYWQAIGQVRKQFAGQVWWQVERQVAEKVGEQVCWQVYEKLN